MKKNIKNFNNIIITIVFLTTGIMQAAASDEKVVRRGTLTFKPGAPGTVRQPQFTPASQRLLTTDSSERTTTPLERPSKEILERKIEGNREATTIRYDSIWSRFKSDIHTCWAESVPLTIVAPFWLPIFYRLQYHDIGRESLYETTYISPAPLPTLPPYVDPLPALLETTPHTKFAERALLLNKQLKLLHHLIHGFGEPKELGRFDRIGRRLRQAKNSFSSWDWANGCQQLLDAVDTAKGKEFAAIARESFFIKDDTSVAKASSTRQIASTISGMLPTFQEEEIVKGAASRQKMAEAVRDRKCEDVPEVSPTEKCPGGIHRCGLLGQNSLAILSATRQFIKNIRTDEVQRGRSYFDETCDSKGKLISTDINRVMDILEGAMCLVRERNLVPILRSQEPDDRDLSRCLEIINCLVALPTRTHDLSEHMKQNEAQISKLLSRIQDDQQRKIYAYFRNLALQALDALPNQNYISQSSVGLMDEVASHLMVTGETASGKSYTFKNLLSHLGFEVISFSMQELLDSSRNEAKRIDTLLTHDNVLTPLEKKILVLNEAKTEGRYPRNFIIFIDEVDISDFGSVIAHLNQITDPATEGYFDSLHIKRPLISFIIASNDSDIFARNMSAKGVALAGRFIKIDMPPFSPETRIDILKEQLTEQLTIRRHSERGPILENSYSQEELTKKISEYVLFSSDATFRDQIKNFRHMLNHLENPLLVQKFSWLYPEKDRENDGKNLENWTTFLEKTFPKKIEAKHSEESAPQEYNCSSSSSSSRSSSSSSSYASSSSSRPTASSRSSASLSSSSSSCSTSSLPLSDARRRARLAFLTGADPSRVNHRQEDFPQDD